MIKKVMNMKTKKLFLAAVALVALASCSENDFVGDSSLQGSGEMPISFGFDVPTVTRASGADAATKLSNQFVVYGEKSEADDGSAPATGKLVFQNYKVAYISNTAYTTQSNTKNWEYVGQQWTSDERSHITTSTTDLQTIKFWDYSASNYVFTALSALPEDISSGRVTITKKTSATDGNKVYDKGYTIVLAKVSETSPSLDKIYLSDRLVISNADAGTNREAVNKYGGNVTLTFRNLLSQVRAGVYETIPGYDITSIKFYITGGEEAKVATTSAFGAICSNVKIGGGFTGTLEVTYYESGTSAENQPKVAVSGSSGSADDLILGTNMSTLTPTTQSILTPILLGKTAAAPTWDTAGGDYTNVLPQSVDNTTNLKLTCDYTLWNNVTGETIEVTGATAEIPSQYLQWKSNFKYTYLFKISDNTNGSTGQDVTGLYPITFDAVEMVSGDGIAEYITTVSEPSITTFGVNNTGNYIAEHGTSVPYYDYPASTIVYAVVEDGSSLATLTTSNMYLYTVTSTDDTNFPITPASVAEALIEKPTMNAAQVAGAKVIPVTSSFTGYTNTVPAEDGTTKTLDESAAKAAYFTTVASTKYAIVYQRVAPTYVWGTGTTYADQAALDAAKAAAVDGKLYTDDQCTTEANYTWADDVTYFTANAAKYATDGDFTAAGNVFAAPGSVATPAESRTDENTPYYKPIRVKTMGTVVVKVVTCPAP